MLLRRCTIVSLLVIGLAVLTGGMIQQHRNAHRMQSVVAVSFLDKTSLHSASADKIDNNGHYVANAVHVGDRP